MTFRVMDFCAFLNPYDVRYLPLKFAAVFMSTLHMCVCLCAIYM